MQFLDIHTHRPTALGIENCIPKNTPPSGFFSVGIHPLFIAENWEADFKWVEEKSQLENCKALGECGLDKNAPFDFSLQEMIFQRHISLSERIGKPLIIHCVKSFSEIISLKKKFSPKQTWLIHGFRKKESLAQMLIQNGVKLSFGAALLRSESLQNTVKNLRLSDFFLETDNNTHTRIEEIYQKTAQIRGISVQSLQQEMLQNFQALLHPKS